MDTATDQNTVTLVVVCSSRIGACTGCKARGTSEQRAKSRKLAALPRTEGGAAEELDEQGAF